MAKNETIGTREIAKLVGVKPGRILSAIWQGRIDAPQQDGSSRYLWKLSDVEKLKAVFKHKQGRGVADEK